MESGANHGYSVTGFYSWSAIPNAFDLSYS